MTLDSSKFVRGLNQAKSKTKEFGDTAGAALSKVSAIFGVGAGLIGGGSVAAGAQAAAERINDLRENAGRAAVEFEKFQQLAQVFSEGKVDADDFAEGIAELGVKALEARRGVKGAQEAFADLNIDIDHFSRLSPDEKVLRIADAFNEVDRSRGFSALQTLLGDDTAFKWVNTLQLGSKTILNISEQVAAVTERQAESLQAAEAAISRLKQAGTVLFGKGVEKSESFFSGNPGTVSLGVGQLIAKKFFGQTTAGDVISGQVDRARQDNAEIVAELRGLRADLVSQSEPISETY